VAPCGKKRYAVKGCASLSSTLGAALSSALGAAVTLASTGLTEGGFAPGAIVALATLDPAGGTQLTVPLLILHVKAVPHVPANTFCLLVLHTYQSEPLQLYRPGVQTTVDCAAASVAKTPMRIAESFMTFS
jgi:hypothetical protein